MTVRSALCRPIALGLTAINLAGLGYAVGMSEPAHAGVHAVLALAFGYGAQRMRRGPRATAAGESPTRLEELQARLDALELESVEQQRELIEAQERLDFAERLLAQRAEERRVGVER